MYILNVYTSIVNNPNCKSATNFQFLFFQILKSFPFNQPLCGDLPTETRASSIILTHRHR